MKKNLLLLCVLSGLICTMDLGMNINNVTNEKNSIFDYSNEISSLNAKSNGFYSTNDGIVFDVVALGKGINLTKRSLSQANVNNVNDGSYIFDNDWLVSKYDEAVQNHFKEIRRIEHVYSLGLILNEITKSVRKNSSNGFSFDASNSPLSNGTPASFNSANVNLNGLSKTHLYIQDKICYDAFRIDMPELPNNISLYSEHLSEGFTNLIEDIIKGHMDWTDMFNIVGTHVLTSVSYGGYTSFDLEIYSTKTTANKESSDFIKSVKRARGSHNGVDTDFKDELFKAFAEPYDTDPSKWFCSFNQDLAGGKGVYSIPLSRPDDFPSAITTWLKRIEEDVAITKFNEALPIWEFLPSNIQNRDQLIKDAIRTYNTCKKKGTSNLPSSLHTYAKSVVEVDSKGDGFKGSHWTPILHGNFEKNQGNVVNLPFIQKHGYNIAPTNSGEAKDGWKSDSNKYPNVEFFSINGTTSNDFVGDIDTSDNHSANLYTNHFVYKYMSFKYSSKLDLSNELDIKCFTDTLKFLIPILKRFF